MEDNKEIDLWFKTEGADTLRKMGIRSGQHILDFGCGPGRYTIPLAQVVRPNGRVIAVDSNPLAIFRLHRQLDRWKLTDSVTVARGDGGKAIRDIAPGSLDAVLFFDVIQHVKDRNLLFEQVHRILKPSGTVYLYPSAVPHPHRVDMDSVTEALTACDFTPCSSVDLRLLHRTHRMTDRVHVFERLGG